MFDSRWGDDPRDRDDDDAALEPGRGSSSRHEKADSKLRDNERRPDDRDSHGRDPRDVFMRDLDLPRGREREVVYDARDRAYPLRGSETRSLSTVGAFPVVPAGDLRDHSDLPADPRSGDLRHLREQGLINTVRLDGRLELAVVLTERGRDLLEQPPRATRAEGGEPSGNRARKARPQAEA